MRRFARSSGTRTKRLRGTHANRLEAVTTKILILDVCGIIECEPLSKFRKQALVVDAEAGRFANPVTQPLHRDHAARCVFTIAGATSSVMTENLTSCTAPKFVEIATSAASRPRDHTNAASAAYLAIIYGPQEIRRGNSCRLRHCFSLIRGNILNATKKGTEVC
jgi:hypothetical protein